MKSEVKFGISDHYHWTTALELAGLKGSCPLVLPPQDIDLSNVEGGSSETTTTIVVTYEENDEDLDVSSTQLNSALP